MTSDGSHTKPGVEILSPLKMQHKDIVSMHQQREGGEKYPIIMCTRWWITRTFPLSCQQQYVLRISLTQWQRCSSLQKSNGNLTLIILHFWFTFESLFDCIRWLFGKKKKKPRSEYISAELESSASLSLPCTSIYRLIIQSENENWSLKHLYLNKEREADYECSKCNFYYTSIILLLITDSFSLCSSSKTRSYSIHVHTGAKKGIGKAISNV